MSPKPVNYTSLMLLAISLCLMAIGAFIRFSDWMEPGSRDFASGAMFKVGMVVGLGWLAAPQLEKLGWSRLRGTGIAIILAIGGLTAVRPRFGAIAAGIAIGGFVVLALLGWVRGAIFNAPTTSATGEKSRKIEKNPTKR
ncbi:MAG: hypothetical protein IT423_08190 [Pirellulaceae bacterium]|nr:hypothetical protein [Pirellulaceae bacterium]